MAAKRCSTCSINYPVGRPKCGVCGEMVWYVNEEEPDANWMERVADMRLEQGLVDPLPGVSSQRIVSHNGGWYIADENLRMLYPRAAVGTIIRVMGHTTDLFFELGAPVVETDGEESIDGWWLQRIDPDGAFEDATVEAIATA